MKPLNKLVFLTLFLLIGCSRYNYPIVTKYKELNSKVRYEIVKKEKTKHNIKIPMIVKEITIFVVLSAGFGYITLKEK